MPLLLLAPFRDRSQQTMSLSFLRSSYILFLPPLTSPLLFCSALLLQVEAKAHKEGQVATERALSWQVACHPTHALDMSGTDKPNVDRPPLFQVLTSLTLASGSIPAQHPALTSLVSFVLLRLCCAGAD
eukprot:2104905-Rhodomonas_salina.1